MYSHILLSGAHRPVLAAASSWAAAGVVCQDGSLKKSMTAHTKFRHMLLQVYCPLEILKHNQKPSLQTGNVLNSGINYITLHFPLIYISGFKIVKTQTRPFRAKAGIQLLACHMPDLFPLQVSAVGHTVNQSLTPDNSGPSDAVAKETFLSVYLK